uniref:YJU2 splicing factor homolog n=1 Tax=Ciona intestinalis TaxID=7719 RepID=UPI00006A3B9D|nr:YJU2 splicing factor homolog [Ciona intestinalis]|eukprot:XP_002131794.1 YJU2 splicing factor homolog [Ciona intestinalis]
MSERKVLNKYYPPDYDPSKIPKLKRAKDRQYVIRVMAPFHMRCKTCGNYIYKGTKFNARMETVQTEDYLGLRIYRFYIKCTKCVAEITFKTDPENMDYAIEHGATRNFEAEKLLEQEEKRLQEKKDADEANPMKMLEIRTRDSKREMEMMESLEELRELNERVAGLDYDGLLRKRQESEEERIARLKQEEDEEVRKIFDNHMIRRLQDDDSDEEDKKTPDTKKRPIEASSILTDSGEASTSKMQKLDVKSKKKTAALLGIVRKTTKASNNEPSTSQNTHKKLEQPVKDNPENLNGVGATKSKTTEPAKPVGLSLLGGYGSNSSSNETDSD